MSPWIIINVITIILVLGMLPRDIEEHKSIAITIDIAIIVTACMGIVMLLIPEH